MPLAWISNTWKPNPATEKYFMYILQYTLRLRILKHSTKLDKLWQIFCQDTNNKLDLTLIWVVVVVVVVQGGWGGHVDVMNVDVMSTNCDVIIIFLIYGQFGAIQKPDSRHRLCKTYIFINKNLLSYKHWKQN